MMEKIFISGAHGSACSLIKSLAVGEVKIHDRFATCHESWQTDRTQKQQDIFFYHIDDKKLIQKKWDPDVTIWLKIDKENIDFICRRIVVLDFIYTEDPEWMLKDWCWTPKKHYRLAGPDWPGYSNRIIDYPNWCIDEMCQVAWERSRPWTIDRDDFDYTITTNELFGNQKRTGLEKCFSNLGLSIDHDSITKWREKNLQILEPYMKLFSWTLYSMGSQG